MGFRRTRKASSPEAWRAPRTSAAKGMVLRAPMVTSAQPAALHCSGVSRLARSRPNPTPRATRVPPIRAMDKALSEVGQDEPHREQRETRPANDENQCHKF